MKKNKISTASFLLWYFKEKQEVMNLGNFVIDHLLEEGTFEISVRDIFDSCHLIPQAICRDNEGNELYFPHELELIPIQ